MDWKYRPAKDSKIKTCSLCPTQKLSNLNFEIGFGSSDHNSDLSCPKQHAQGYFNMRAKADRRSGSKLKI